MEDFGVSVEFPFFENGRFFDLVVRAFFIAFLWLAISVLGCCGMVAKQWRQLRTAYQDDSRNGTIEGGEEFLATLERKQFDCFEM